MPPAILYGPDAAFPPDVSDTEAIWANGWRFWAGYVGGPRVLGGSGPLGQPGRRSAYDRAAFVRLQNAGFLLAPPFYVGRTSPYDPPEAFSYERGLADGDDANELMGLCGFNEDQPLTLDAEYGDYQNEPQGFKEYLRGFVERCNQVGHKVLCYSDLYTLDAILDGFQVDGKWGAAYGRNTLDRFNPLTSPPPAPPRFDPALPPPWTFWQFAPGSRYDVNSASPSAPFALCTPA
jgi:hypothetical protein